MSYHKITRQLDWPHYPQQMAMAALAAAKINIKSIHLTYMDKHDEPSQRIYEVTFEYQFRQDEKYNWATHSYLSMQSGFANKDDYNICREVFGMVIDIRMVIEAGDPGTYNYLTAPSDMPFEVDDGYTRLYLRDV